MKTNQMRMDECISSALKFCHIFRLEKIADGWRIFLQTKANPQITHEMNVPEKGLLQGLRWASLTMRQDFEIPAQGDFHGLDLKWSNWYENEFDKGVCYCGLGYVRFRSADDPTGIPYGYRQKQCEAGHIVHEVKIYD